MYWACEFAAPPDPCIQRADLFGNYAEDLASGVALSSIAIEKKSGKLYLAGGSCLGVYWANLDGSGFEKIISEPDGTYDIDVDPVAEKIY